MRQVVVDTETTGLDPEQGHRIIEIGGVELVNRRLTDRRLHYYLQPDRDIDVGALEVHGITRDFLQGKPRFAEVHSEILSFVADAEVIIHNAPFDVGFIDHELARLGDWRAWATRTCGSKPAAGFSTVSRWRAGFTRGSATAWMRCAGATRSTTRRASFTARSSTPKYSPRCGSGDDRCCICANTSRGEPSHRTAGALTVPRANHDELEAHARQLAHIDEKSGGECLWLRLDSA